MAQNRRTFLATLGGAMAGIACARPSLGASLATRRHRIQRIGIQLYSVRQKAEADLPGVLAQLSAIGYKEVETAGYYRHSASEWRELLQRDGLVAPSAHIDILEIERSPSRVFDDAHTIGHEWITVPSPSGRMRTIDDWKAFAGRLNVAGRACIAAGFRFAYHNHDQEFRPVAGQVPFDAIGRETDPSVVSFQIDLYHAVNGGADPVDLLARFGPRIKMFHVKDMGAGPKHSMVDVGTGTIDFKTIFARADGGIEHYFVENDEPEDPLAFAAASYRYLASLEF